LDELATKFEEFTLVSCLSTNTVTRSAWFVDSGASHHMIEAWDLFNSLVEKDSSIYVELGYDAKYAVKGEGTILFQLDLGDLFESKDVLYVLGIRRNFLSVSVMEDKGFSIMFKKGKGLIHP
jgi:hypothetical protein